MIKIERSFNFPTIFVVLSRLLSLDVSSLEDVYWLEDSTARHVLDPKDFNAWSAARQSLPTGKEALITLKTDLWNTVVKNSKHQDAWTWGEGKYE